MVADVSYPNAHICGAHCVWVYHLSVLAETASPRSPILQRRSAKGCAWTDMWEINDNLRVSTTSSDCHHRLPALFVRLLMLDLVHGSIAKATVAVFDDRRLARASAGVRRATDMSTQPCAAGSRGNAPWQDISAPREGARGEEACQHRQYHRGRKGCAARRLGLRHLRGLLPGWCHRTAGSCVAHSARSH